jgi:hypothetical protein
MKRLAAAAFCLGLAYPAHGLEYCGNVGQSVPVLVGFSHDVLGPQYGGIAECWRFGFTCFGGAFFEMLWVKTVTWPTNPPVTWHIVTQDVGVQWDLDASGHLLPANLDRLVRIFQAAQACTYFQ